MLLPSAHKKKHGEKKDSGTIFTSLHGDRNKSAHLGNTRSNSEQSRINKRKWNRGSMERRSYTNTEKVMLVDEVQDALDNGVAKSAQEYFEKIGFTVLQARMKAANFNKWKKDEVYSKALSRQLLGKLGQM